MSDIEHTHFLQSNEIDDAIKSGEISVNWNGHYGSGDTGLNPNCSDPNFVNIRFRSAIGMDLSREEISCIHKAWKTNVPLEKLIILGSDYIEPCWECGKEFKVKTDGINWIAESKCKYPHGVGAIEFELNVPSGKMVVANDLRNLFPILSSHNVNTIYGIVLTIEDFAKIGMAHCNVGNTCPAMFECPVGEVKNSRFTIGISDENDKPPMFIEGGDSANEVAHISTDLWWYSICDYEEYTRRAGKTVEELDPQLYNHCVVQCVPGVYHFKHVYHLAKKNNFSHPQVYTYIERIREPDPIVDYMAHYNSLHLTAEQIIAEKLKNWPTLYVRDYDYTLHKKIELPFDEQFARVASHLMLSIGNGEKYHPNGFWGGESWMTNDSPAIESIVLDKPYNWYPGYEKYSVLSHISGLTKRYSENPLFVNDSFIALAFNICRCILVHGIRDYQSKNKSHVKNTFKFIKKCMVALKERYPDKIPLNCVNIIETNNPHVFKELK